MDTQKNKHSYLIRGIDACFVDACRKGDMACISMFCKFDPYKYSVVQGTGTGSGSGSETGSETDDSNIADIVIPICYDSARRYDGNYMQYGLIRSLKNQMWHRICVLINAVYCHKNIPMDIVRVILTYM